MFFAVPGKQQRREADKSTLPTMMTPAAAGPTTQPSPDRPLPLWPPMYPQFSSSIPWYHPQLASPFGGGVPTHVTSPSFGQYPFAGFGGSGVSLPRPAAGAFSPVIPKKPVGTGGAAGGAVDSAQGLDESPGGIDEAGPATGAAGAAGVDTRNQKDLMQELLDAGITDADATEAVQQLRSALIAAGKLGSVEQQHAAAIDGIDIFKGTQFGLHAYNSLMHRGFAIAPVFPSADKDETTRFMSERIYDEYFTETTDDGRLRVPYAKGLRKINDQDRWMVNLEETSHKKSLGPKFMEGAETAVQNLGFVLQALVYSIDNVVDAEKLTLLLSAAGEASQVLHKDQDGKDVQKRLMGSGSGTRGRAEPAPYTGMCAFRDPVYLHVNEASHKNFLKDDYDWSDMVELIIPPGYGILFHSCLVHSGSSYEEINGRLHIYFKCKNGRTTFDNTFHQVKHDETKQPAARKALS